MAIPRVWLVSACFFLGALHLGCRQATSVRDEDVRVAPATVTDIQQAVRNSGAKVVLVNVWATWCGPCREEFPGLMRVTHQYRDQGLKVILVSADLDTEMAAVKHFLAAQGVDFPCYIKAEKDQPFIDALDGRWTGALPAMFIYDGTGKLIDFWEGSVTFSVFEKKVVEALGQQAKSTGGNP